MLRTIVLAVSALIIVIVLIVSGAWLVRTVTKSGGLLGPRPSPTPTPPPAPFTSITQSMVTSLARDASGTKVRYFDYESGQLKIADFTGVASMPITGTKFAGIVAVYWSPKSNQAILEYSDPKLGRQFALFDPGKTQTVGLDSRIRALAWSPDGTKIVYAFRDDASSKTGIFSSDPDGRNFRRLLELELRQVTLFWLPTDTVLIVEKPAPSIPNIVLALDIKTGRVTRVVRDLDRFGSRFGISVLPSPDGKKLLVSSSNEEAEATFSLEIITIVGTTTPAELPFATLAEKCAWSSDNETLYCAVPDTIRETNLPFSYWTGETLWHDRFVKYRTTTGERKDLTPLLTEVDALFPVISAREDAVSYINRYTGTLDAIKF